MVLVVLTNPSLTCGALVFTMNSGWLMTILYTGVVLSPAVWWRAVGVAGGAEPGQPERRAAYGQGEAEGGPHQPRAVHGHRAQGGG